jgi:hypothetical protein
MNANPHGQFSLYKSYRGAILKALLHAFTLMCHAREFTHFSQLQVFCIVFLILVIIFGEYL